MINPEKAKKLRPLRIFLTVAVITLFVLVLDTLPTSRTIVKSTTDTSVDSKETRIWSADEISEKSASKSSEEEIYFCTFTDLLASLEEDLEARLDSLGVPEEEYKNLGDYLGKDEIYSLELKASLAASLELSPARATPADLSELGKILPLDTSASTCVLDPPAEYKELSDLLKEYNTSLTTTEDYDESHP